MISWNQRFVLLAIFDVALSFSALAQSAPAFVSFAPASGNGPSQIFTTVYDDSNGASDVLSTQIVITNNIPDSAGNLNFSNSCMFGYNEPTNSFLMVKDDGSGWMSGGSLSDRRLVSATCSAPWLVLGLA